MDQHSPKRFSLAVAQGTDRPNKKSALKASTTTTKKLYITISNSISSLTESISFCKLIQYVTRAATAVRNGLKEPAKTKAMQHEAFSYNAAAWESGKSGKKKLIQTLSEAGK